MSTTPKMIRLGTRSLQILEALRSQLADQYSSEAAVLSEATRRGLLLMAVEAWHEEAGQYGGHEAKELARILKHELTTLFNLLLEHDELPAMLRVPMMVGAPTSGDAEAPTAEAPTGVLRDDPALQTAAVVLDGAVVESVQLGGQDEDWDE